MEKKTAKRIDHQSESSKCLRRQLNLRISFKKKLERIFGKENVWTRQQLEDLTTVGSQKMVSSAAKRKIKTKGNKMLTLERYFESCGRDLSGSLSWTKWYGLHQNLALGVASHARKRDFSELWQPPSKKQIWQTRPEQHRSPNSEPRRHQNSGAASYCAPSTTTYWYLYRKT